MKIEDLEKAIEDWRQQLIEEDLERLTIRSYMTSLYQLKSFLEDHQCKDLTKEGLIDFKNALIKKREAGEYKTSTINTRLLGIDRFLNDNGLSALKLKTERIQQKFMLEDRLAIEDLSRLV